MANAILVHNLINVVSSGEMKLVKNVEFASSNSYHADYEIPNQNTWAVAYLKISNATVMPEHVLFYDSTWYTVAANRFKVIATGQIFESSASVNQLTVSVYAWNGGSTRYILSANYTGATGNALFYK